MSGQRAALHDRARGDQISLWLVEDNDQFRKTISTLINNTGTIKCERAFISCEDALAALDPQDSPEVVLMDIGLPGMSGLDGIKKVKSVSPGTDVIMLTVFEDNEKIFKAICAGASGYLLKSSSADHIIASIQEVVSGGAPMNAQIARKVLDMFANIAAPKGDYHLTDREKDILKWTVQGLTKKVIAEKMFLSYHTVDAHLKSIYIKLQVNTRSGAVAKVLKENLL